jgi:hypothetical protein
MYMAAQDMARYASEHVVAIYGDCIIEHYAALVPVVAPIYLNYCENVVITKNTFIDVVERPVFTVIYLGARANTGFRPTTNCMIIDNDYTESGVTVGGVTICVWLSQWSSNNLVAEEDFPEGTTVADQVLDEGTDNTIIFDDD